MDNLKEGNRDVHAHKTLDVLQSDFAMSGSDPSLCAVDVMVPIQSTFLK
jgi:hypothetical protein